MAIWPIRDIPRNEFKMSAKKRIGAITFVSPAKQVGPIARKTVLAY